MQRLSKESSPQEGNSARTRHRRPSSPSAIPIPHHLLAQHDPSYPDSSSGEEDSDEEESEEEEPNVHSPLTPAQTERLALQKILKEIVELCCARGEQGQVWVKEINARMRQPSTSRKSRKQVDYHATKELLSRVLGRIERGEFLLTFDDATSRTSKINHELSPEKVVVYGKGKGHTAIEASKRPMLMAGTENFLDATVYADAENDYPPPFPWSSFSSVVLQISNFYSTYYPEQVKTAQEWHKEMLNAGREQSHSTWEQSSRKGARVRFNLIVTAEKLSGREKLPSAHSIFEGIVSLPQNVDHINDCFNRPPQFFHSLGRISIRQARRIGYVGRIADDGGYEF